jgi:hypothetical protein
VIIHGWNASTSGIIWDWEEEHINEEEWPVEMARTIYWEIPRTNVFVWDWMKDAIGLIPASGKAPFSAGDLAYLLNQYLDNHPDHGEAKIHLIGDGLGGLVALTAADFLVHDYGLDVDQVTLLDPFACGGFLGYGGYEVRESYFIDQYSTVLNTLASAYISPDVNVYISNTESLLDAHSVPREWYMEQSIVHAGEPDNEYGFYWSTAYGGSRDEAQNMIFYVGYPWDYRLSWVDYKTYPA